MKKAKCQTPNVLHHQCAGWFHYLMRKAQHQTSKTTHQRKRAQAYIRGRRAASPLTGAWPCSLPTPWLCICTVLPVSGHVKQSAHCAQLAHRLAVQLARSLGACRTMLPISGAYCAKLAHGLAACLQSASYSGND
eukprot:scaffold32590_cov18-Tisochrysis_lutea.AAC.1